MFEFLVSYFSRVGKKRVIASLIGNLLVAVGIALFKQSVLGNDPFTGMNMSLADLIGIRFPLLQLGVNLLLFCVQVIFEPGLVGFGTVVNALLIGSLVDFFYGLFVPWFGLPTKFAVKLLIMLIGMVICCFGLSVYQNADLGVSPYDAASLILSHRNKRIPYFWFRIFTDGICVMI